MMDLPLATLNEDIQERTTRLFRIYNHYRIVMGALLVSAMLWMTNQEVANYHNLDLYQIATSSYLAIHGFVGLLLLAKLQPSLPQISLSLALDIALLSLLIYSSNGIASGYSNLLFVSVAAANILIQGRLGTFFAALAALSVMLAAILLMLNGRGSADDIIKSGLIGMLFFATAFLIQSISRRLQVSEQLAQKRAQDVAELEHLNRKIIQRMRTGIIVADEQGNIRLINEAAYDLLSGLELEMPSQVLPLPLLERLFQWRIDPAVRTSPFRVSPQRAPVQANFAAMEKEGKKEVLLFLEDTSKITQQAQQMKLASLGRLTAGIAHEIRNPLGAISHAGQLLLESPTLSESDRKMGEIILRHSARVNGIIESVLQLSRRKQPEPELLDLNSWLKQDIDDFTAGGTTNAEILCRLDPANPQGRFDPNQLSQVIANLLGNGLRYSEQKTGKAVVHVETGLTEQQQAYIDIIDEGPGISDELREHLFEPFFTTEKQGTGLGLYISRELCEANQAQLDADTAETGGCRFRITFAHPKRIT